LNEGVPPTSEDQPILGNKKRKPLPLEPSSRSLNP